MAVLQRLSLPNIDRILQALLEDAAFSLVTFDNQPKGKESTPDARIGTGSAIWVETKTARNAVRGHQVKSHLNSLRPSENLLLLTPDDEAPAGLDDRVAWSNFRTLAGAVEDILGDESEPPSEKEAFLLRELILMLRQDGLLDSAEPRVMVIGARFAWPMYERLSVYRCSTNKPMQSLRDSDHMAFYVDGKIQPLAPRIKSVLESIDMTQPEQLESLEDSQKRLAKKLRERIDCHKQGHEFGQAFKVMFLSGPTDDETVKLEEPIVNDKKDKNGKPTPFTFGQPRFVQLPRLELADIQCREALQHSLLPCPLPLFSMARLCCEVVPPLLHEHPAAVEQVGPGICLLDTPAKLVS